MIDILKRIENGEDSYTQFKVNITNADKLAQELVAFSNAKGGWLIIGVDDDANIVGLSSDDIKRLNQLIELHKEHQTELMQQNVGKILNVFFEDLKPNGEIMGFSDNYIQVFVEGSEELLGQIVDVKITSANRTSLKGVLA